MSDSHDKLDDLRIDRSEIDQVRPGGSLVMVLIGILVVVAAGVGTWLVLGREKPVLLRVAEVREIRVDASMPSGSSVLDASGYVVARRRATISSKITGKIIEVAVEEGLRVEKGQVLARLDDALQTRQLDLARARVESARSALEETRVRILQAELDLRRQNELFAADVGTQADLDSAETAVATLRATLARQEEDVRVAESEVELWVQQLDDTVIRAPFTGIAVSKNAQPGEMISPSAVGGFTRTGICTLVDMSSLEIEVDVNESYIQRVAAGQPVRAQLDAYPNWQIPASVITTIPTADRQKATVKVRIAFEQLDPRILPEMGVEVSFLSDLEKDDGADADQGPKTLRVVAASALRRDGDQDIVFVARGQTLERRAVTTGSRRGDDIEILGGLTSGERVVVEGPEILDVSTTFTIE